MMSHQGGQESQPGYMDGVCVKISEKYKPPPRINLAVSYSQRLSLNQQIRDGIHLYNFSLETNVKERMHGLKHIRQVMLENKREKLEKIKTARQKQIEKELEETTKVAEVSTAANLEQTSVQCTTCEASRVVTTDILYPTYSHILTPTPLVNNSTLSQSYNKTTTTTSCITTDKSPFNIADFEADTSSPFDNMELKTINDIEELAQVLKKDESYNQAYIGYVPTISGPPTNYITDTSSTYTTFIPQVCTTSSVSQPVCGNTTVYSNLNGIYYNSPPNQNYNTNYNNSYNSSTKPIIKYDKLVSHKNINKINKTLHDTHISNKSEDTKESGNVKSDADDEIYELLPKNLQQLSQSISLMGFPLARVAKACQALGDDQKKVVEYLLVMSELLDLGFSENAVSSALLQCNNDRDRALDILIL